jgi:hypothetical protein
VGLVILVETWNAIEFKDLQRGVLRLELLGRPQGHPITGTMASSDF